MLLSFSLGIFSSFLAILGHQAQVLGGLSLKTCTHLVQHAAGECSKASAIAIVPKRCFTGKKPHTRGIQPIVAPL